MRRCLLMMIAAVILCLPAPDAHADDNVLSAYGGLMIPSADYGDEYDSMGLSLGVSMIRVNEYAGLEFALSGYSIGSSVNDSTGIGMEVLVHFMDLNNKYQPYFAMGMGVYSSKFTSSMGEVKDTGSGFILKVGARYYFEKKHVGGNKYFWGLYYKRFTNNMLVQLNPILNQGFSADVDAGGQCLCFEIGVWTD